MEMRFCTTDVKRWNKNRRGVTNRAYGVTQIKIDVELLRCKNNEFNNQLFINVSKNCSDVHTQNFCFLIFFYKQPEAVRTRLVQIKTPIDFMITIIRPCE